MKKIWILIVILIVLAGLYLVAIFDVGRKTGDDLPGGDISNPDYYLFKTDLVRVSEPLPNVLIANPVRISGFARGNWFFEASFPVELRDKDGRLISQGIATAKSDPDDFDGAGWMTTDFVPFEASLSWPRQLSGKGEIVLKKDNPSGLPEFDDEVILPILFSTSTPAEVSIGESATTTPE